MWIKRDKKGRWRERYRVILKYGVVGRCKGKRVRNVEQSLNIKKKRINVKKNIKNWKEIG